MDSLRLGSVVVLWSSMKILQKVFILSKVIYSYFTNVYKHFPLYTKFNSCHFSKYCYSWNLVESLFFFFLWCIPIKAQFDHVLFRIRNTYPACDLKTNTGKIWSVATKFPDHILGKIRLRISIWTDYSPSPLLLTQHGKWLKCLYVSVPLRW